MCVGCFLVWLALRTGGTVTTDGSGGEECGRVEFSGLCTKTRSHPAHNHRAGKGWERLAESDDDGVDHGGTAVSYDDV